MTPQPLHPVPALTPAERIRRLSDEARNLAREEVGEFVKLLVAATTMADQIASGGEAYPVGAREIGRRLSESLGKEALTLAALLERG